MLTHKIADASGPLTSGKSLSAFDPLRTLRAGLCVMAAGLAWSGSSRFLGYGPGVADLMFLGGIMINLWAAHGVFLLRAADRLDGQEDGRIGPVVTPMAAARRSGPLVRPSAGTEARHKRQS